MQDAEYNVSSVADFINNNNFFSQLNEQRPAPPPSREAATVESIPLLQEMSDVITTQAQATDTSVSVLPSSWETTYADTRPKCHHISIHRLKLRSELMETFIKKKVDMH